METPLSPVKQMALGVMVLLVFLKVSSVMNDLKNKVMIILKKSQLPTGI